MRKEKEKHTELYKLYQHHPLYLSVSFNHYWKCCFYHVHTLFHILTFALWISLFSLFLRISSAQLKLLNLFLPFNPFALPLCFFWNSVLFHSIYTSKPSQNSSFVFHPPWLNIHPSWPLFSFFNTSFLGTPFLLYLHIS